MYITLPGKDWCVYFNNSLVEDVYYATDDTPGMVILYEHDGAGNRVPWYDASLKHEEWALLSLEGNVEIKRSSTAENYGASDWFKKFKTTVDNEVFGLGLECVVDTDVSFIMTGGNADGVPYFRIPQFGSKYEDCDWTITSIVDQSLNDVWMCVTRMEGDNIKKCGKGEAVEVALKMMGPAVIFERNAFSYPMETTEYNYEKRLVDMKLIPGYGTAANFVVSAVKKVSRSGP